MITQLPSLFGVAGGGHNFFERAVLLAGQLAQTHYLVLLLAGLASILMLLARASQPHVAFLGRVPGTNSYSDLARHPENEALHNVIAFRPEASLLYVNADSVLEAVSERLQVSSDIRLVVCDLSASPYIDLAGGRMRLVERSRPILTSDAQRRV
jgi:SulP family sulfate permease